MGTRRFALEGSGFMRPVVPAAIPPAQLDQIRVAYDRVVDAIRTTKPREAWSLVRLLPACVRQSLAPSVLKLACA